MNFKRVKFQRIEKWYAESQFMAIKCGFHKKPGLMDWLLTWFEENYQRYTLKRMPAGAYQNADKSEKIMEIDMDRLARITAVSRKMGYIKPTDVLNWVFYNIQNIIEVQEQIEEAKDREVKSAS